MTIQEQVLLHVYGSTSQSIEDTTVYPLGLDDLIDESVSDVIGDLPRDSLYSLSSYEQDSGEGVDLSEIDKDYIIPIGATFQYDWLIAKARAGEKHLAYRYQDPRIRWWYQDLEENKVYVKPYGGTVVLFTLSKADLDAEGLNQYQRALKYLIVMRTGMNMISAQMLKDLNESNFQVENLPTAPVLGTFPTIPTVPTVGTAPNLPTKPTTTTPITLTLETTNLANVASVDGDKEDFPDEDSNADIPDYRFTTSVPSFSFTRTLPTFSFTDSLPDDISTTIDTSAAVTEGTPTSFAANSEEAIMPGDIERQYEGGVFNLGLRMDDDDIEMADVEIRRLRAIVDKATVILRQKGTIPEKDAILIQKASQQLAEKGTVPDRFQALTTRLNLILQRDISAHRTKIEKRNATLQAAIANTENNLNIYQADLARAVRDFEGDMQEYTQNFEKAVTAFNNEFQLWRTDMDRRIRIFQTHQQYEIAKADREIQRGLKLNDQQIADIQSRNANKIGIYNAQVDGYFKRIQSWSSEFQALLSKWSADTQASFQTFELSISKFREEYSSIMAEFQSKLEAYKIAVDIQFEQNRSEMNAKDFRAKQYYFGWNRLTNNYNRKMKAFIRMTQALRPKRHIYQNVY